MKKFFKNLGKKSQSRGPPPGGSPKLGAGARPSSSTTSLVGYDVKEKELGKLHRAAWLNDVAKVKQLAKKDPSCLDKENRTPLHLACARGHAEVVQELLEWKAKTNIGDNNSKTPLMKAVECGYPDCVDLLLDSRADVDVTDRDGNTCLHVACSEGMFDIATMLVKARAKLNAKNKEGLSPLHYIVNGKKEDLCRLLLKDGADVNSEDKSGRTCLMKACQEGKINLVKILLEFGADTAHKDTKGWTADDCAVIQGHHACSQLISDHNLRQNMANRTPLSTPRSSLPPSLSATPRDKSSELGVPAADVAVDDDSGDETVSKGSEMGARGGGGGYDDSWGDDTDLSLADDRKGKDSSDIEGELEDEVAMPKVNLAKFIPDSDDGDSSRASRVNQDNEEDEADVRIKKYDSTKSVQSNASWEDDSSWSIQEKKTATRVSFKRDEELSEIHDISMPESEDDLLPLDGQKPKPVQPKPKQDTSYVPTGMSVGVSVKSSMSAEQQRAHGNKNAFMEELGISDGDDVSDADVSEVSGADPKKMPEKADDDSDWDSTAMSDPASTPRPGILKKWNKQTNVEEEDEVDDIEEQVGRLVNSGNEKQLHAETDGVSDWDSYTAEAAIMEDKPPPLPMSPIPAVPESAEIIEAGVLPDPPPLPPPKEEGLLDTDEELDDDFFVDSDEVTVLPKQAVDDTVEPLDLMSTLTSEGQGDSVIPLCIEQDEHMFEDEVIELDSCQDVNSKQGALDVSNQESDWDSTVGMVTPRQNAGLTFKEVKPGDDDEDVEEDPDGHVLSQPVVDQVHATVKELAGLPTPRDESKENQVNQEDDEEDSEWDSDTDLLPSDNAPVPPQKKDSSGQRTSQHSGRQSDGDSEEDVDTETISEWEVERKKQKEAARFGAHHKDFEDIIDLTQAHKDQTEETLKQKAAEEERKKQEEERRRKEEEEKQREAEERRRVEEEQHQEELRKQELRLEEERRLKLIEEERQREERRRQEEEMRLADERRQEQEELKRQRKWEEEEQLKAEKRKREAEEALREEQLAQVDVDDDDDFFGHKDERRAGHAKDDDDFELSDNELPVRLSAEAIDRPPVITMSELDDDLEELKRVDDKVEEEKFSLSKVEDELIQKAIVEVGQSPVSQPGATKAQVLPIVRQQPVYAPPLSLPPTKSTSQMLKQRLRVPRQNSNRMEDFEDDDSYASDNGQPESPHPAGDRPDVSSYYPNLLGPGAPGYSFNHLSIEDDALSYTSTEFDTESLAGRTQEFSPFTKDNLLSLNMNDPSSLVKLQEHHRELKHQVDHGRTQQVMLESKLKIVNTEKTELHKKIELLTRQKVTQEQDRLDLEAKIRDLQYNIREEEEKRHNAEVLLEKTKDQLNRKEEKFTSAVQEKQKAELERRNMEMDLRTISNRIKELESEREELERQVEHERETRLLQEKINEEQAKVHDQLHQQKVKAVSQLVESKSIPVGEISDEDRIEINETLRAELEALQNELERQKARSKDEHTLLSTENEDLQDKIEELKHEIKLNEEALTQATMQYSVQMGNLKTEYNMVLAELEKEKNNLDKVESELESQKVRLASTMSEMEKASKARNELERDLQYKQEEARRELERKQEAVERIKETSSELSEKLRTAETKISSLESEIRVTNNSLLEKNNQLKLARHELERSKSSESNMDQNLKLEKEHSSKLQSKLEALQDKLTQSQHETLNIKQQLETARHAAIQDANMDAHEKFNTMMASIKSENEKARLTLEEKNTSLSENVTKLREDLRNSENRRSTLESDLRHLNQEHNELVKKLSHTEATQEMAQKMREQVESDRSQLRMDVERLQQKYQATQEKLVESQARVSELVDRMEKAEHSSLISNQQLAHTSANIEAFSKSKTETEESYQKLQIDCARLEAELKHEKQRAEMLHQDLQDSQKVRGSLEALCSNLKSTNGHLEDKLGDNDMVLEEEGDSTVPQKDSVQQTSCVGQPPVEQVRTNHLERQVPVDVSQDTSQQLHTMIPEEDGMTVTFHDTSEYMQNMLPRKDRMQQNISDQCEKVMTLTCEDASQNLKNVMPLKLKNKIEQHASEREEEAVKRISQKFLENTSVGHFSQSEATFIRDERNMEEGQQDISTHDNHRAIVDGNCQCLKTDTNPIQATAEVVSKRKLNVLEVEEVAACARKTTSRAVQTCPVDDNDFPLTDTLHEETANRSVLQVEAQESKGMWEQEVVSRSKLGLRIAQLDRQKQDAQGHVDEEKRKVRKALEAKKVAESKYETERDKSLHLQKEIATLKIHLKTAKKKVKDPSQRDSVVVNLSQEFEKERTELEEALATTRNQLCRLEQQVEEEFEERQKLLSQNLELKSELCKLRTFGAALNQAVHSKFKLDSECFMKSVEQVGPSGRSTDVDSLRAELEAKYRMELNRKLEEVNRYLEEQARARDRLDMSRGENDSRLSLDKRRLEEEILELKLKYEKALAQRDTKDVESRRFRDLYENEMKWRTRLSEQLQIANSKTGDYKTRLSTERQRSKFITSMNNLNMSAMTADTSRLNATNDDPLSNRIRAELDRSIAKHLEAAPHDDLVPALRCTDDSKLNSAFAKSSADYYDVLKRKFCVQ